MMRSPSASRHPLEACAPSTSRALKTPPPRRPTTRLRGRDSHRLAPLSHASESTLDIQHEGPVAPATWTDGHLPLHAHRARDTAPRS